MSCQISTSNRPVLIIIEEHKHTGRQTKCVHIEISKLKTVKPHCIRLYRFGRFFFFHLIPWEMESTSTWCPIRNTNTWVPGSTLLHGSYFLVLMNKYVHVKKTQYRKSGSMGAPRRSCRTVWNSLHGIVCFVLPSGVIWRHGAVAAYCSAGWWM